MDWLAEHQRRAEAFWRRAQRLGAVLEVGRVLHVGDEQVEVVATLADATQTVVAYRVPPGSMTWASPVRPWGSSSGTDLGDLRIVHMSPADSPTVAVTFGDSWDDDGDEVELPIDRARTRRYERRAARSPVPVVADGVRIRILGAVVGVLMATIDLEVTSDDLAIVAATLGSRGFLPHPHRRAGSGPLWRDWHPPADSSPGPVHLEYGDNDARRDEQRSSQSRVRGQLGAAKAVAKVTAVPATEVPAPLQPPPMPWRVHALPDRRHLGVQGSHGEGGPIPEALSLRTTLRFDPPPDDALGLELSLEELFVFLGGPAETVHVPGPSPDEPVDLSGRALSCGSERVDLVRWEPTEHGTPSLVVRPLQPGRWPDIRVVAGNASVSLWLHPTADAQLSGGLPGMYDPLFPPGPPVTLGLRMLGRRVTVPPMTIPLTAPTPAEPE